MIFNLTPDTKQKVLKIVKEWGELIRKISSDCEELLSGLADACAKEESHQLLFPFFLRFFYEKELFSESDIITWYDDNSKV